MCHRLIICLLIWGAVDTWAAAAARAQEPDERSVWLLAARNARKLGAYEQAIARYRAAINLDPTQWDAIAELGWLLVETGRTADALEQFEAAAALAPDNLALQRNTARAYGWAFQYERALAEFDSILNRFSGNTATTLERDGKEALWLGQLRRAEAAFERLVELEPQNSEVLFDLGQIAARQERPAEAQALYRRLLAAAPGHRQAALGLQLSERLQRPLLALNYAFTDQQGYDGKRSIRYGLAGAEGRWYVSDELSARLGYQNAQFHFGRDSLLAHLGTLKFGYRPYGYLRLDGFMTALHYDHLGRDRVNVGASLSYDTLSDLTLRANFERRDLWENRTTVLDGITVNRLAASVSGALGRRIDWTIEGNYANYSDDNTRIGGELQASYRLLWFPRALRLLYRGNAFGFQRERSYFSPGAYATNTVAVEFQYWFGYPTKEDYLAEAPRNTYAIYYGISIDSNGKPFNEARGRLTYALVPKLDVGLSLKMIRSTVYDEWGAEGLISYTF